MQTNHKQLCRDNYKRSLAHLVAANDNCGFTLVELMIALVIIMMLATIAITNFARFREDARVTRCMNEIRTLEREITAWSIDKASLPANLGDIGRTNMRDPWGGNYVYSVPTRTYVGDPINTDFDLYSKGPNGLYVDSLDEPESEDDVIRGRTGNYVGLAIKYL